MERAARERGRRRGAATGGGQAVLAEDPRWVLTAREMWAAGGCQDRLRLLLPTRRLAVGYDWQWQ